MSKSLRSKKPNVVVASESGGQSSVRMMVTGLEISPSGRSCQVCRGEDTDEMVCCDRCEKWHHYQCVGVTAYIEQHPWSCAKCEGMTSDQDHSSNANKSAKNGGRQKSSITEKKPPRKPASNRSETSSRSSNALLKLKLQKLEEERKLERRQAAEEAAKEMAFLEEKYKLLEEMVSEKGSSAVQSRIDDWVDESNKQNEKRSDRLIPRDPPGCNPSQLAKSQSSHHTPIPLPVPQITDDLLNPVPVPAPPRPNSQLPVNRRDDLALTHKQLAARQAISKELPTFSGNPDEWPLFLSSFNNTTAMCGFSDTENIIRLQKSLKGRAYDAVKSRLMHPANVNGVMATLRMMFGQPEAIVHTLIAKINSLPTLREDKLETLVDFAVNVENFCATVDACGLEEHLYNVSLMHQLVGKLPPSIKLNWAQYRQTLPAVNLASFSRWLYSLAEAASAITIPNIVGEVEPAGTESRGSRKGNMFVNSHSENIYSGTAPPKSSTKAASEDCIVCKGTCKSICNCKRFLEMSRDSRWSVVREFGLCRKCLRRHYGGCQAKLCGKNGCQFKHHELLHNGDKNSGTLAVANSSISSNHVSNSLQSGPSPTNQGCHTHQVKSSQTLFRYLPVMLHGKHGSVCTFAFLDDRSALTLIDSDLADELRLEGEVKPLCLHWTGGTQRQEDDSRIVNLEVAGTHDGSKKFSLSGVRTVQELLLPSQTLNIEELSYRYPHLLNLPITSYEAVRPRILIGMKDQHLTLVLKSREGDPNQPLAVKTRLGWTVCGGSNADDAPNLVHSIFHVCPCVTQLDEDLHQAMKAYFSMDSMGAVKHGETLISKDEQRAQSLLQSLTRFTGTNYETGLLWRYDDVRLPDSRAMAMRRFDCLEKRLTKDPKLAEAMQQKITDYLHKGYIRKSEEELARQHRRIWYLPVFPVTNPNKPRKLRIVWDAAATAFGKSLNSFLLTGPDQLASLFSILIQFRERAIGLTGDLREMFHQVLIRDEDQLCQLFYWRNEDGQLSVYAMLAMTFGACCSPSSAQYVKNLNAERFREQYPKAADVIQKRHYVDDMLVSVDTEEEAIQLAQQVKFVHAKGGFEIRNWVSNSQRVLTALNESSTKEKNLDLSPELATEKVLGMWWCTVSDAFT